MQISEYLDIKKNQDFIIKIFKIILLGFVSFSLFASAIPFYLGYDDVNYGLASINLSEGNFTITNSLEMEFDKPISGSNHNFIPNSYVKTAQNDFIPKGSVGIFGIGSLFYGLGGLFGLFYFGPIVTTILLIIFDRFVTKLFGSLVGLLALLFLVGDWQFFFVGLRFLTDNLFSLFFILGVFSIVMFTHKKDYRYVLLCSTFFSISTLIRINGIAFFPAEIFILLCFFVAPYLKESKIFTRNKNNSRVNIKVQIFLKSNFKNFLKISSSLLTPWIIFLVFWLSFNAYYFDDPGTSYRDQAGAVTADIEKEYQLKSDPISIEGEPLIEFQRLQLVQYYSVPLLPDTLYFFSVIISDTDLEQWRSDIWISYITFSILALVLIFSLYFKIKRKETLIFLFFIITVIGFYSSPLVANDPLAATLSEHANSRYMIPASLLSYSLIGFFLVEGLRKYFPKNHKLYEKILHPIKKIYLIMIIAFFLALIVTMPSFQDFYQTGFHFNNPFEAANLFNNLEQLPENSLIVSFIGRNTLLHTDTHFYSYGTKFVKSEGDTENIPTSKTEMLKKIMSDGYTPYTFKNNMFIYDEKYFRYLESDHGIILKDYSKTFCKLELISNTTEYVVDVSSDPICFKDDIASSKNIWNVHLKWPY